MDKEELKKLKGDAKNLQDLNKIFVEMKKGLKIFIDIQTVRF
jgi:hypothetical protein